MLNRLLSLVLAATLLAACNGGGGGPIEKPQPPPHQAFAIIVRDFVRPDLPVADAQVACQPSNLTGTTNADGYLAFDSVRSYVVYNCDVQKEGYESNTASHYLIPDDATLSIPLTATKPPYQPGLQGRLRIEGGCFRDDTGCVLPTYAHAGDMFSRYTRDPDFVRSQLDLVSGAGFHGVRTWAVLGGKYWAGREVGPDVTDDYWGHLERFLTDLHSRNLRAVWSMGDIGYLQSPRQVYMQRLYNTDSRNVIDWLDCGNEAWQTGEPSANRLAECVGYYKSAGGSALLTLTSGLGETKPEIDQYSIPPADAYDVHGYRGGNFWDKLRHIFSIPYESRPNLTFGIQSEPFGSGGLVSVTSNKQELDDETMGLAAVMSHVGRQAWVWFSGEGVILQKGLQTENGFNSTVPAVRLLPNDLATFSMLHHSGTTWSSIRVLLPPSNDVRIDGRQHSDGRFVQVIYGPGGTYTFWVQRAFEGKLCHPVTATCEDVSYEAGQGMGLTFTRGRILIGRFK